jgi:sterol desaturase/sphingolipid hydroxylase (fatty acid hydroxylase superfamily)
MEISSIGIDLYDSFEGLFSSSKRIYWQYILSSLFIALIYLLTLEKKVAKKEMKLNLSYKLWLHKSAVLDYKYFVLSFFIKVLLILPFVISVQEITIFVYEYLLDYYGYMKINTFSYSQVVILFTVVLFIVSDFTRYWLHRFLHTIPFLWEFHKVHHSAKVLTPITFYRVHPVENLLFGFRYALSIGVVTGVFLYFFGAMIGIYEILGTNVFLYIFSLMGSNLRHSHIKLSYPKIIENICISPFQHQLHHSTKYYNKNFGGYLSIWDNLFGTLQTSCDILKRKERIKFGVETHNFDTIGKLLITPFKKLRY